MLEVVCVAGVRRGGKGERRAHEEREDRTREDRGTFSLPPSISLSSLPFYGLVTQAMLEAAGDLLRETVCFGIPDSPCYGDLTNIERGSN